MYNPKYSRTDYLVYLLNQISVVNDRIKHAKILPSWEVKLRRDALVESTYASTSIEGNSLSLREVSEILLDRKSIGIKREKKEVENYYHALVQLKKLSKSENLTSQDILTIHLWIMNELPMSHEPGSWRKAAVVVGNRTTGKISYVAPPFAEVRHLIEDLLEWCNLKTQLHPIIKAGIMHYQFVWIHPFGDGNGRTARSLASLILLREGFDDNRFVVLDDYYNADRSGYYASIRQANKSHDLTEWLEYFAEGVLYSLQAVSKKIESLSGLNHRDKTSERIYINKREEAILAMLEKKNQLKSRDVQQQLKISRQAAAKILKKMIEKKLVRKIGRSSAVTYVLPVLPD